jgi:glycosyltransferase involved in cell wall biosynthesis
MSKREECLVSAILPLMDADPRLPSYVEQVHRTLQERYANFEILLVADMRSAVDGSLVGLLGRLECIRMIRLSRRVGHDVAMSAGLELSIGDFVVVLSPLRTPPSIIPSLVAQVRKGPPIVLGVPVGSRVADGLLYRWCQSIFQKIGSYLNEFDWPALNTDTIAFARKAVLSLTHIKQKRRHLAVLLPEMGFPWDLFPYEPMVDESGILRRPLLRSIRTGFSVIIESSTLPLRLVSLMGLMGSSLSVLYAAYVCIINFVRNDIVQGWTTLSLQISGLLFLVFVMLALLGEYMLRILDEASQRPLYHIADEKNSSVMVREPHRLNVYYRSDVDETREGESSLSERST